MQNITTFLPNTDIKPEIALIYVHDINSIKYAVVTDSFKLVQYKLPDFLQEHMPVGYYTGKAWKEIAKAHNAKKMDIRTIMDTINTQTAIQKRYNDYVYPDYEKVIPKDTELVQMDNTLTFNKEYYMDFIKLIPVGKFQSLSMDKIKQLTSKMIIYKDENITLLLMSQNK